LLLKAQGKVNHIFQQTRSKLNFRIHQFIFSIRRVALVGRRRNVLEEVDKLIREKGGESLVLSKDVSKEEDVITAIQETVDKFGRIDIGINNAAM
jgi:NAD(P)-dependent dehydrogenase (short-subunit alcohol dehydrogenase family)